MIGTPEIRAQFPALDREYRGNRVAYFDGPGGTQVPRNVIDAVAGYLADNNANTRWRYPASNETDQLIAVGRNRFADFFNCSPSEVVFGANMTTLTYHLSRSLGTSWGSGDEIVISALDHAANQAPWQALATHRGARVRIVPFLDPERGLTSSDFEPFITNRTRLVAVGAASNAIGLENDLVSISRLARSVGALVFVDGVHAAAHTLPDVQAIDCDFFACSAYKFYGPHVGAMFVRDSIFDRTSPLQLSCAGREPPRIYETGTLCHEGIAGASAAVDFLAGLSGRSGSLRTRLEYAYSALKDRGRGHTRQLLDHLGSLKGIRLLGPSVVERRTSTIAFTVDGRRGGDVAEQLAEDWGLFITHGDFYAPTVMSALDVAADLPLRVGTACYTSDEEVTRLATALETIAV